MLKSTKESQNLNPPLIRLQKVQHPSILLLVNSKLLEVKWNNICLLVLAVIKWDQRILNIFQVRQVCYQVNRQSQKYLLIYLLKVKEMIKCLCKEIKIEYLIQHINLLDNCKVLIMLIMGRKMLKNQSPYHKGLLQQLENRAI